MCVYKVRVTLYGLLFLCRLLKCRLEKQGLEGELKELQDSLSVMKKQKPAFDDKHSRAEVIHVAVCRLTQIIVHVWVKCRGSVPLLYICRAFHTALTVITLITAHVNAHSAPSNPHYSSPITYPKQLQRCHDDLKQARAALDKQKDELDGKSEALQNLKRASGEREAELLSEIGRLKEQAEKDKAEVAKALEKAKEVKNHPESMKKK